MNKRDTQFAGFAQLEYDDLYWMFNNLFLQEADGSYQGRDQDAERTRRDIKEYLAHRAYDLVQHAISHINLESTQAILSDEEYEAYQRKVISTITDMSAWPEREGKA